MVIRQMTIRCAGELMQESLEAPPTPVRNRQGEQNNTNTYTEGKKTRRKTADLFNLFHYNEKTSHVIHDNVLIYPIIMR